ncbi:peptidase M20 [Kaistia algarum]|uniref:M20/M25/M40 family metallo-hydrolase n=1 Tax=Kaistia algarum TaxID=2083279 RepID=UPI000CE8665C|nr:M20/M25/M40 family metallo-hydrolase [Kaistia algarum]MCX5514816.1 M20/M25/M40 family metallo-hydrolase [Kaistia algarum]PPE79578.1 peptidase M20 [Kaistia algarum]
MIREAVDANFGREVEFLKALIRLPSSNPPGDCAPHAEAVAAMLQELGFHVEIHPVPDPFARQYGLKSIVNLIVRRSFGVGRGPVIALNAHGDVVPPGEGWSTDPYGADERRGAIYGRGAAVSKSDFATYAFALLALGKSRKPLDGGVELHFTYDEESGGFVGPKWLLEHGHSRANYAITAGFSYAITTAHSGVLHLEVIVRGRQAHSSVPSAGADALEATVPILAAIYAERRRLASIVSADPGIGSPQITVGLISGGTNTNVVPERIVIRIDRRLITEEDGETVEAELIERIEAAAVPTPGIEIECRRILLAEPLRPLPGVEQLVAALKTPAEAVLGVPIEVTGVPLFTDARHYAAAGIPTVLYGAGPRSIVEANAYSADEHLRLDDLRAATEIVARALETLLSV